MSKKKKTKLKTSKCPECEREWPHISEACIVLEEVGKCYSCFILAVIQIRDARIEEAGYKIENCARCLSLPGAIEDCPTCLGMGWHVTEPREKLIAR